MIGAHEMERATHLQDGARSTILAERVDLRCRFVAHIHRDRRRIALRGKRDPPMPPRHAGTDAVADDLACYLHGLIVVIGIGAAEVDDGRVVDERAVGQLLRVHRIVALGRLIGMRGSRQRKHRRKQHGQHRDETHERNRQRQRLTGSPPHDFNTRLFGLSDTIISATRANRVTNSRRPAHICAM